MLLFRKGRPHGCSATLFYNQFYLVQLIFECKTWKYLIDSLPSFRIKVSYQSTHRSISFTLHSPRQCTFSTIACEIILVTSNVITSERTKGKSSLKSISTVLFTASFAFVMLVNFCFCSAFTLSKFFRKDRVTSLIVLLSSCTERGMNENYMNYAKFLQ